MSKKTITLHGIVWEIDDIETEFVMNNHVDRRQEVVFRLHVSRAYPEKTESGGT